MQQLWSTPFFHERVLSDEQIGKLFNYVLMCETSKSFLQQPNTEVVTTDLTEGVPAVVEAFKIVEDHLHYFCKEAYGADDVTVSMTAHTALVTQYHSLQYHNHTKSHLTAVLYVNVPSGDLQLFDPRGNANRNASDKLEREFRPVVVTPKAGDLIILPSYVFHATTPNMTQIPRCFFVFDIKIS